MARTDRREILTQAVLGSLGAVLLFWGLNDKYLWQDEAATAILADRMLRFGKPLAYDGLNLVTVDFFATEDTETIGERTHGPKAAVDYYVHRGDFKPDTTWKWEPWGQFIVAAAGLRLFGHNTLGARVPFALVGLATVLLFYRLARKYCDGWAIAAISTLVLVTNSYWILHARQCRYYSLSSLLLIVTLMAYLRWQEGRRWGIAAFVAAAWCWFQVDYGTVWPVFGVLFLDSLLARRRTFTQTITAGAALAASVAPFVYYYELWGRRMQPARHSVHESVQRQRICRALAAAADAVIFLTWRWNRFAPARRHPLAIACGVLVLLLVWLPVASPEAFLRYLIMAAPLGVLVAGWFLVRACPPGSTWIAWIGALVLMVTPVLCVPGHWIALLPDDYVVQGGARRALDTGLGSLWRPARP